jgi:hypothetical protein
MRNNLSAPRHEFVNNDETVPGAAGGRRSADDIPRIDVGSSVDLFQPHHSVSPWRWAGLATLGIRKHRTAAHFASFSQFNTVSSQNINACDVCFGFEPGLKSGRFSTTTPPVMISTTGDSRMRFGGLGRCMVVAMLTGLAAGCVGGCSIKSADTKGTATTEADSKSGSDTSPSAKKPGQTAETVSAEGSSTVYLICQAFAVEFENKFHHSVSVGRQGTGGGYNKFVVRQADIWNASRPIDKAEVAELQKKGIGCVPT